MKNSKLTIWTLAVTLASFSACSNTKDIPANGNEIILTSEILPSRVTSLNVQSTQIVEGQQVGVTIVGADKEHNNVSWHAEKDGSLSPTDAVYWTESEVSITAYHPFNADWTGSNYEFSVSTDQSHEQNYLNSDLLWATTVASKEDAPVAVQFQHKLAKINITLKSGDITDLSNATVYICGTCISADFSLSTGALSAPTSPTADIKAGITTDSEYTSSTVIIPQTINGGTRFIKIILGGKEYSYNLADNMEFESGHSYHFVLSINNGNSNIQAIGSDFEGEWG